VLKSRAQEDRLIDFMFSLPHGGRHQSQRSGPAELSPVVHEVPALLEKVTTSIGGLDRVADSVEKGLLNDVVRVGRRLGGSPASAHLEKPE
jgi:hypothetical protein